MANLAKEELENKLTALFKQWEKAILTQTQANHVELDTRLGIISQRLQAVEEILLKGGGAAPKRATKKPAAEEAAAAGADPAAVAVAAAAAAPDVIAAALAPPSTAVPGTPFAWFTAEWKRVDNQVWRDAHTTPELKALLDANPTIQKKKADDVAGRLISAAKPAWDYYKGNAELLAKLTAEHAALLPKKA